MVVKGGKAAAPAPVPALAPAKKAPALAPSNSEAPTSMLEVPAPAPSPGPSVSNYFRMKPWFILLPVKHEAFLYLIVGGKLFPWWLV